MKLKDPRGFRALGGVVLVLSFVLVLSAPVYAQLIATTPSVNFGNQVVGTQTLSPLLAEIANTSTEYIYTVTSVSSSLSQFDYAVSGSLMIPPGGVLDVWVWFTPSSAQLYSGTLTFTGYHNHSVQITLSGNGVLAPQPVVQGTLSASSSSVDLGPVGVGSSGSQVIAVTNSGAGNVTFSNVSVSGSGIGVSGLSSGQVLAPGQTAAAYLSFTPAVPGSVAGTVTISSDASNSQLVISVSGSGVGQQTPAHSVAVALTWNPSVSNGVVGYNVYRGYVSGGSYSLLTSSTDPTTNYTDASVQSGQTYYYVVTAVDSSNAESAYSSEVSVSVP